MYLAGVDDAGRGPIIGPMVMAGVKILEEDHDKLKDMGCKDSKLLTKEKREELFTKIQELANKTTISIIHPEEIDAALNDPKNNLNSLEAQHFSDIINQLNPTKVIIDCPSPNIQAYHSEVYTALTCQPNLICEHKADLNHPVVAAASILAKVTRDRVVENLKKEFGDFGSGYLSDPKTKAYFQANWEKNQAIFRKTWAPYKALLTAKHQSSLGDF